MNRHLQNIPYADLVVGMEAEQTRICKQDDLYVYVNSSGNLNPMHLPNADGDGDGISEAIAPGMWVGSLISAVLGCQLPGPGTLYHKQELNFVGHAVAGETLTAKVRLIEKCENRRVRFDTWVEAADGRRIVQGQAEVIAPAKNMGFDATDVPGLTLRRHVHFDRLLKRAEPLPAIPTAVVAPEEPESLGGAILAAQHTLIDPILIGDADLIAIAAEEAGIDLRPFQVIDVPHHKAAAARAVQMINSGEASALMKGHLHTNDLLAEVVKRDGGWFQEMRRAINERRACLCQWMQKVRIGIVPCIHNGFGVRKGYGWELAFDAQEIRRARGAEFWIIGNIFPPVFKISRGERVPVRPFVAFAQMQGKNLIVLIFIAHQNVGHQLIIFVIPNQAGIPINDHLTNILGA